jgi:hypothetical protein
LPSTTTSGCGIASMMTVSACDQRSTPSVMRPM